MLKTGVSTDSNNEFRLVTETLLVLAFCQGGTHYTAQRETIWISVRLGGEITYVNVKSRI